MKDFLVSRYALAAGVLGALMAWELIRPKRPLSQPRLRRWLDNLSLSAASTLLLAVVSVSSSLTMFEAAKRFELKRIGLLNLVSWPYAVKFALGFLLLDLAVFAQHWAFHAVPWFWRVHKVHHTDLDLDATTGLRFHPLEILLSFAVKLAAVGLIGAHFLAVGIFETVLNLTALFNHADVRIPERLDAVLRLLIVTPDMHRVHHSARASERECNFGFNLPWWDHLLGTYEADSKQGPILMTLGLEEHRDAKSQNAGWLLTLPFK